MWTMVNGAMLILWLSAVVIAALRPTDRKFVPGLVLIGAGVVGTTVRELGMIPAEWVLPVRIMYIGIAVVGFVLILGRWRASRSSVQRHS